MIVIIGGAVAMCFKNRDSSKTNLVTPVSVTAKYDELKASTSTGHPFLAYMQKCRKDSATVYSVTTSDLNGTSYYYQHDGSYLGMYEFSDIGTPNNPQPEPPIDLMGYTCERL